MTGEDLLSFANGLRRVGIEGDVGFSRLFHRLTIQGVDFYWRTDDGRYDGFGSSRPDVIEALSAPHLSDDRTEGAKP